jgi:hypothetical protein
MPATVVGIPTAARRADDPAAASTGTHDAATAVPPAARHLPADTLTTVAPPHCCGRIAAIAAAGALVVAAQAMS